MFASGFTFSLEATLQQQIRNNLGGIMTITQTTQSTASRVVQRIAVAGGAAAIAAVAFSGAASAAPFSYTNNQTFGGPFGGSTSVGGGISGNIPSPGNPSTILNAGGGVTRTSPGGKLTAFGPSIQVNLNPAKPFKPTILVSNTAATTRFGGLGGITTGGIKNGLPSFKFTPIS